MNPWALTSDPWAEPWRLWTAHLTHHSLEHAAGNLLALAIPILLAPRGTRGRLALGLIGIAPMLSMGLLPFLEGGTYRGLSALACACWAWVGLLLLSRREEAGVGLVMLGLLGLKLAVEGLTGTGLIAHDGRWQSLSASHLLGSLTGLSAGACDRGFRRALRRCRSRMWELLAGPMILPRWPGGP